RCALGAFRPARGVNTVVLVTLGSCLLRREAVREAAALILGWLTNGILAVALPVEGRRAAAAQSRRGRRARLDRRGEGSGSAVEGEIFSAGTRLIRTHSPWLPVALVAILGLGSLSSADGADNLRLAPRLSFTDDSSDNFPIRGGHLEDADSRPGRATVMFFGAAHCWNTNREAERLVALYAKSHARVTFIIVDVNRPSPPQRPLLKTYYHGAIPTLVILARDGGLLYAQAGETARTRGDTHALDSLIRRAVGD